MQAPSAMNTPERLTTDQARSQNTGFWRREAFLEEEQRTGIGQGKDSQICSVAGWTSGAASSGAMAAKWHEKKFLKAP